MNSYYEAHITLLGNPDKLEPIIKSIKWKFSKIDGDPNFGDGIRCYATRQYNGNLNKKSVLLDLHSKANILEQHGTVIRKKIELVIYDDRSSLINFTCSGNCPECTL